ncbi:High affinity copper uptake protein 1 [Phytophthora cinnamomi]|uniref:High affinity copper uptake protein 1 n=1 Tax=Phytophthora cinnamomi TaxID=4785 RepID=UPI00355A2CCD|nr:High affinity copper uptake protein 1 [Phytophthora cinnamomi]
MRTLLGAALCGLAAATSAVSAATLFPHVPVLLWSQSPVFAASNAYLSSEMDEAAVASAVQRVLSRDASADKEGVLSTQLSTSQPSEVLCLFLLPSLTSDDVSQLARAAEQTSFVQNAVQSAKSSVVIPHSTRTKPLLPEMTSAQPHIVAAQDLDVFIASAEGKTLLSDGKTDLLVVQLPEDMTLPDVDAAIQTASSSLNAATGGKTDFGLTGNDASSVELQDPLARRLSAQAKAKKTNATVEAAILCEAGYLVGYSAAGKAFCFSHYVNITPDIMAGLLFGMLFIFMAYIGLGVLHQIQTPQRYPSHGAPRGKEF